MSARTPLPALEDQVLARWTADDIPRRSVTRNAGGPVWLRYEPPRSANGMPGVHHIRDIAIRDLSSRYKTMLGPPISRLTSWLTSPPASRRPRRGAGRGA
jgi:isoleucyl-tRNA synthetase